MNKGSDFLSLYKKENDSDFSTIGKWYLHKLINVPFFPWRKFKKLSLNEDSSTLSWWFLINSLTSAILKLRKIVFLLCNHRIELTSFFFLFSFLLKFLWILICFRFVLLWLDSLTVVAEHSWTQKWAEIYSLNSRNLFTILWRTEAKPSKFKSKNYCYWSL